MAASGEAIFRETLQLEAGERHTSQAYQRRVGGDLKAVLAVRDP